MNNVMNRRHFGALVAASGAALVIPSRSGALAMEAERVAHHLRYSDRMSMLTERVAKTVALIRLDINTEDGMVQLKTAHDEFDDILLGFATGEGKSGIAKERVVGVRNKLKTVAEYWAPMRVAVEEILASGVVDDAHFEYVASHDEELEHAAHEVVQAIEDAYGEVDIGIGMALAIDLAGRQRMLTQKMTKDVAFFALDYHVEASHADFEENTVKFGKIIDVLITGGANIMTINMPPSEQAAEALNQVKAHWTKMEPLTKELLSTSKPSIEQVTEFAAQSETLLEECDTVTQLYAHSLSGDI